MTKTFYKKFSAIVVLFFALTFSPKVSANEDLWKVYGNAESLIKSGDYDGAIDTLKPHFYKKKYLAGQYYLAHARSKKIAKFIAEVQPLAESGNGPLAYYLAEAYRDVIRQYSKQKKDVIKFYKIALDSGDLFAALRLGNIYFKGYIGFSHANAPYVQSYSEAENFYSKCVSHSTIGMDCLQGVGHTLFQRGKTKEAIEAFEKSRALPALWAIYYFGMRDVLKDANKADAYLKEIMKLIDSDPQKKYSDNGDIAENFTKFLEGDAEATLSIAGKFANEHAFGVPQDNKLLIKYLKLSAGRGSGGAAEWVAGLYEEGNLVRRDYVLAYTYYNLTLENGNEKERGRASTKLNALEEKMTREDISEGQRLARELLSN